MDSFAHPQVREGQREMIDAVGKAVDAGARILVHAPTGIGKTAAVLSPMEKIKEKGLVLFFLTGRHTQHEIVVETARKMREKGLRITIAPLIGKRWMCAQKAAATLHNQDFMEYCHDLREREGCEFYLKTKIRGDPTPQAKVFLEELKEGIHPVRDVIEKSAGAGHCPYEIACFLARDADIIIGDYYHLFNDRIRESLLARIGKPLSQFVVVVDEAHNLPSRIREMLSSRLSDTTLSRAKKEADKFGEAQAEKIIDDVGARLHNLAEGEETIIERHEFLFDHDTLTDAASRIHEKQPRSFVGGVGTFLEEWEGDDEGFVRILAKKGRELILSRRCLDPSLAATALKDCHSAILMSGTLSPIEMYRDMLAIDAGSLALPSPFPKENLLALIVPLTTTRYSQRTENQFSHIAQICSRIISLVPGNVLLFFPSYDVLNRVVPSISGDCPILVERQDGKHRHEILEKFSGTKAALAAVSSGSFGEGIDLKGNVVKCVVVIGLPLARPDIETKALITLYDRKYGKGWSYGYTLPAMVRTIQNAGRCIRSETDRGAVIFLDQRYTYPSYFSCFPPDWDLKITKEYDLALKGFFS